MPMDLDAIAAKFGGQAVNVQPTTPTQAPVSIPPSPALSQGANLDLYNSLNDEIKPMINAMAEGRTPALGRNGLDKNFMTKLSIVANQIDPTLDSTVIKTRQQTRNEYAGSKTGAGANLTALNTSMNHLTDLYDNFQHMNNGNTPWVNSAENSVLNSNLHGLGDYIPSLSKAVKNNQFYSNKVTADATGVAGELAKAFRSVGMSENDIAAWKSKITPDMTPSQMKGIVGEAIQLMNGRFDPLVQKYNNIMGANLQQTDPTFMTPQTVASYKRVSAGTSSPDAPYTPRTKDEYPVGYSNNAPPPTGNANPSASTDQHTTQPAANTPPPSGMGLSSKAKNGNTANTPVKADLNQMAKTRKYNPKTGKIE